jgi:hypothetical protein
MALPYTADTLREYAEIDEAELQRAREMWRKYAPKTYRDLMDAPLLGGAAVAVYMWDAQRRQYYNTRARAYLDPLSLRNMAIDPFLNNVRLTMRDLSGQLQTQNITVLQWHDEMMSLVKYSQMAAALIANGGIGNTNGNDIAVIVFLVIGMLAYLQAFAEQIASGEQVLNGRLLSRSDLYAWAGRDAYEEMRRYEAQVYMGMEQEKRVLDPQANHCVPGERENGDYWESCPELADKGWQPIGTLPRIRDTPCRVNCKCTWRFQ